jgi:hypothetical protein
MEAFFSRLIHACCQKSASSFLLPNWLKAKKEKFFCCLKQKKQRETKKYFNFFE